MRLGDGEAGDLHLARHVQIDVSVGLHGDRLVEVRREPVLELQRISRAEKVSRPLMKLSVSAPRQRRRQRRRAESSRSKYGYASLDTPVFEFG
jgi:hypothetical protein